MNEGELKKRIYNELQTMPFKIGVTIQSETEHTGTIEFPSGKIYNIIDEAKKDFPTINNFIPYTVNTEGLDYKDMLDKVAKKNKQRIDWFKKWFGT